MIWLIYIGLIFAPGLLYAGLSLGFYWVVDKLDQRAFWRNFDASDKASLVQFQAFTKERYL